MRIVFTFILALSCLSIQAQNLLPFGKLPIYYFSARDYNGVAKCTDAIQDDQGNMLFANQKQIIVYNGFSWKEYYLEGAVRKFIKNTAGEIYVGGAGVLGKMYYNEKGEYKFRSLLYQLGNENGTDEIFQYGSCKGDTVYFSSELKAYRIIGDSVTVVRSDLSDRRNSRYLLGENLFLLDQKERQLQYYNLETGVTFTSHKDAVTSSFPLDITYIEQVGPSEFEFIDSRLTTYRGLILDNKVYFTQLRSLGGHFKKVDKASWVKKHKGFYIVGVENRGVVIFNNREIIREITTEEGLNNTKIENVYLDRDYNLWVCSEDGINKIELIAPVTFTDNKDISLIEGVTSMGDDLYLASRNPIISKIDLSNMFVSQVRGSQGLSSFGLKNITYGDREELVFLGDNSTFVLEQRGEIYDLKVVDDKGNSNADIYTWDVALNAMNKDEIFVSLDVKPAINLGIISFVKVNGRWEFNGYIVKSEEIVHSFKQYGDTLVYSVSEEGPHFINLKTKERGRIKLEGVKEGDFKGATEFEKVGEYYFVAPYNKALFISKSLSQEFKKFDAQNIDLSKDGNTVFKLKQDGNKRLWAVMFFDDEKNQTDTEIRYVGYFELEEDGSWTWMGNRFKYLEEDLIRSIYIKDNIVWLGGDAGLYAIPEDLCKPIKKALDPYFSAIISGEKDTLFYNFERTDKVFPKIPFDSNSFEFHIAFPSFYGKNVNMIRYRLLNHSDRWSIWKNDSKITDFKNLNEGEYTIEVEVKDYFGRVYKLNPVTFEVLPPWYRSGLAGLAYLILFILFVYGIVQLSLIRVKRQNQKLEETVKERTQEIAEKNHELEEKNADILDSIKYAKRIQNTILPNPKYCEEVLGDHFIFYKPKDIVSGDFYWVQQEHGYKMFAAVDCTGHGVPGAFVSLVGSRELGRSVNEFSHKQPADILNKLNELVQIAFQSQTESEVKDGMDLALCCVDEANKKMYFSGAHNSLYMIRNGELTEFKANKQPIGNFEYAKDFTEVEVDMQDGDAFYVFSDGYVDQFGGERGKKFKSKPFKKMLLEIYDKPMKDQLNIVRGRFENWMSGWEQVDDICVIGFKYHETNP